MNTDKDRAREMILAKYKPGCICKGIPLHKILSSIESGAASFQEIARETGIGKGSCGGKRCGARVAELLGGPS